MKIYEKFITKNVYFRKFFSNFQTRYVDISKINHIKEFKNIFCIILIPKNYQQIDKKIIVS